MSVLALPLVPLVTSALIVLLQRHSRLTGLVAITGAAITLSLGVWAALAQPELTFQWSPAIQLGLGVEGFSRVMVILVPAVEVPVLAYAASTEADGRARLLALMTAFLAAMLLLVMARDFLMLLIGWELVGACSWALIAHAWRKPDNPRFARRVFVMTRTGDLGLYIAAGLTLASTGTFGFSDLGGISRPALDMIAAGVLLAAAAKSAQLPFAPWLFWAMAAPTPVSALLHSATLVAAGAYLLIVLAPWLAPVAWFLPVVAGIGLATTLAAGIVASIQHRVKQVLAGSTSAQYGLMFLAVGAGSSAAAGAHLVAHALFKSLLFLGAGVAMHAVGSNRLADMRLGRSLPTMALLSLIGVLALAALPPLGAAWTKEQVLAAAVHLSPWVGAGALVAGFFSALYGMRYQLLVYGLSDPARPLRRRPGRPETVAMGMLAAATLLLSLLWLPSAAGVVESVTVGDLIPSAAWELALGVAIIIAAAGVAVWSLRQGTLVGMGLPPAAHAAAEDWLGLASATQRLVVAPVLSLARVLAQMDDRVIDAGIRTVVAGTAMASRLLSRRAEWTFDGVVRGTAAVTLHAARASRTADDAGIDAAVEGSARVVSLAGNASRRLQTGMAHHYYVILAAGVIAMVLIFLIAVP